jgi:hypothetical protein
MKRKLWMCAMSAVIAIAAGSSATPARAASVRTACLGFGSFCQDEPGAEKCCVGGCTMIKPPMTLGFCNTD